MKKILSGIFISLITFSAYSGPFGLEMGQKIDDLKKLMDLKQDENNNGWYHTTTVPAPSPDFAEYVLSILPEDGLCNVAGMSGPIKTDDKGDQFVKKFSKLESQLIAKFGIPLLRLVPAGANWGENIHAGEEPISVWDIQDKSVSTSNISWVRLKADKISKDELVINLVYIFGVQKKCKQLNSISKSLIMDHK